jgi:hypothetical protein
MAVDHIRYDLLAQEALRGVLRTVLDDVARKGLPGDHHFYISFKTRADGVRLAARLLTQFPEEMTIVLQHQFWDLTVSDEGFEVGMSFGGIPERIGVPFAAVKSFYDPSVEFGLQFEQIVEAPSGEAAPAASDKQAEKARSPAERSPAEHKTRPAPAIAAVPLPANPPAASQDSDDDPDKPAGGGEVVRLDRFRKK